MPEEIARDDEGKHVVEGDKQKNNEGIGEGDQKGRREVVDKGSFALRRRTQTLARVGAEHVDAKDEEHQATDEFEPKNILFFVDKIHDKGHTETGDEGVDDITQGSPCTRDDAVCTPLLHGALNT